MADLSDHRIWIAPLPPEAKTAYKLLRSFVTRGVPLDRLRAAMVRLEAEELADRVAKRVEELGAGPAQRGKLAP